MNRIVITLLTLLIFFVFSNAQQKGKEVMVVGEVIELQCYISGLTGPGKGLTHKECALKSAKQGIPLGIVEEKTGMIYLVGQTKKAQSSANDLLIPFIAEKVKVSGRIFEKSGMKLLLVKEINKLNVDEKKKEEKK
jgi:hypothetical protein